MIFCCLPHVKVKKPILYIIGNGFDLAFAKSCRTDKQTIEIINL